MTIKELKDWVVRQQEIFNLADDDFFRDTYGNKKDWLKQELLTLFNMIAELEEK
jgi:hypothetical protein